MGTVSSYSILVTRMSLTRYEVIGRVERVHVDRMLRGNCCRGI